VSVEVTFAVGVEVAFAVSVEVALGVAVIGGGSVVGGLPSSCKKKNRLRKPSVNKCMPN
jgi:hypothetical protein